MSAEVTEHHRSHGRAVRHPELEVVREKNRAMERPHPRRREARRNGSDIRHLHSPLGASIASPQDEIASGLLPSQEIEMTSRLDKLRQVRRGGAWSEVGN